jgi:hypothetical protein
MENLVAYALSSMWTEMSSAVREKLLWFSQLYGYHGQRKICSSMIFRVGYLVPIQDEIIREHGTRNAELLWKGRHSGDIL